MIQNAGRNVDLAKAVKETSIAAAKEKVCAGTEIVLAGANSVSMAPVVLSPLKSLGAGGGKTTQKQSEGQKRQAEAMAKLFGSKAIKV